MKVEKWQLDPMKVRLDELKKEEESKQEAFKKDGVLEVDWRKIELE